MQPSTIISNEDGNQVEINVVTNNTRIKDFTFGENNEHHILQYTDHTKETVLNAVAVSDGLGLGDTTATFFNGTDTIVVTMTTAGVITALANSVQIYP